MSACHLSYGWMVSVLVCLLSPLVSQAATYYAAPGGSSTASCAQAQPCSLARGVSLLSAGDTLYLRGGTYAEALHSDRMPLRGGSSWASPITIASAPGETAIVPGAYLVDDLASQRFAYLILDRLVLDGGLLLYGHHVRVQDTEIKNSPGNGIMSMGSHLEFVGLDVHHNGVANGFDHGIYHAGSHSLIANTHAWANGGYGIHVFHQSGGADHNIVRQNRVHDNLGGGGWSCGIVIATGQGNVAVGNEIWNEPVCGLQVGTNGYAGGHQACGNRITNTRVGIKVLPGSQGAVLEGNQLVQVAQALEDAGRGTQMSGCTDVGPLPPPRPPARPRLPAPWNVRLAPAG